MYSLLFGLWLFACGPKVGPELQFSPPPEARETSSGLRYQIIKKGKGASPNAASKVTVHYTAWQTDGVVFDSSRERRQPSTFPLDKVIPGWTEGVQLMKKGAIYRFWIPEDLAYKGRPGTPQGMLIFEVELLSFENPPTISLPELTPPRKARTTESGLYYTVLKEGKGEHPTVKSTVTVHYSGWLSDGTMFDSSVTRGKSATFPLERVIPGWIEGLQLMKEGATYQFWIPVELAYQNKPGLPEGMLIFEIELLSFKNPPTIAPVQLTPPDTAIRTKSGLSYMVLKKGKGGAPPTKKSIVTVEYTGWLNDGTMFESSVTRGQNATFPLDMVIPGWVEGVQLMQEGEKARFWIPANLAYGESSSSSAPKGDLIFDIELISFTAPD
jgi:FKBP-type peptidyl-prolyl cis-trans isomerase